MATATETKPRALIPEQRIVLRGVGWEGYEALLKMADGHPSVHLAYFQGDVELMATSPAHELLKVLLGRMIETMTMELEIPCEGAGSTTWKKKIKDCGIEPDECYYLANSEKVAGRKNIDLNVDPSPDLAIEVEISRSAIDKLSIYSALGVSEVWRFDGETLVIEALQDDGSYAQTPVSPSFPFWTTDEIAHWVGVAENLGQTVWIRQFREWVLNELAPRRERG